MYMKKRIIYIANARMPTEKAHGIQIAKMCEAFQEEGNDIELVLPKRRNHIKESLFSFYSIQTSFPFVKLWCLDLLSFFPSAFSFFVQEITFAVSVWVYSLFQKESVYYTRDLLSVYFLSSHHSIFLELHSLPKSQRSMFARLLKKIKKCVVLTEELKKDLVDLGFPEKNILVAPDGVDRKAFVTSLTLEQARERVHLPLDKKIILYTGHLYDWKGVDTLLRAAAFVPQALFVVVGGTEKEQQDLKQKNSISENILFISQQKHGEMPFYLASADILVLPNSAKERISSHYTSPLKLFEYMCSRRPILASRLPSLQNILHNENAFFFTPDDEKSCAEMINDIFHDKEKSLQKSERAFQDVQNYSWQKRVQKIQTFLEE